MGSRSPCGALGRDVPRIIECGATVATIPAAVAVVAVAVVAVAASSSEQHCTGDRDGHS